MMIFQKIILYFWILMLSYKIINLYIEWYLHYTLDYYINYEYNTYTNLVFIWRFQRQVPSYVIATILFT